jgi:hypothetical protein
MPEDSAITKKENDFIREDGIVKKCIKTAKENFYELIPALAIIREKKLYLTEKHASFESYLQQPEYVLDPTTYNRYITAYLEAIEKISEKEIKDIPVSNLLIISRLEDPREWVHDAEKLSRNGLQEKIKDEKPKMRKDIRKKPEHKKEADKKDDLLPISEPVPKSEKQKVVHDACPHCIDGKPACEYQKVLLMAIKKAAKKGLDNPVMKFNFLRIRDRYCQLFFDYKKAETSFTNWSGFNKILIPKISIRTEQEIYDGLGVFFKDQYAKGTGWEPMFFVKQLDKFCLVKKHHDRDYEADAKKFRGDK